MAADSLKDLEPVKTGRQVLIGGFIGFLSAHATLRFLVCAVGVALLVVGTVAAPFWKVPLLSWLSVGQVAGVSLTGGIGAVGLWWLSRPTKPGGTDA
jgi:hypothetical protein